MGEQKYVHDSDVVIKVEQMKAKIEKNRFAPVNLEVYIEQGW